MRMLEEIMDVEQYSLQEGTLLKKILRWDSMAKVLLMTMVEEKFDKLLTSKDLNSFQTPGEILDYIERADNNV